MVRRERTINCSGRVNGMEDTKEDDEDGPTPSSRTAQTLARYLSFSPNLHIVCALGIWLALLGWRAQRNEKVFDISFSAYSAVRQWRRRLCPKFYMRMWMLRMRQRFSDDMRLFKWSAMRCDFFSNGKYSTVHTMGGNDIERWDESNFVVRRYVLFFPNFFSIFLGQFALTVRFSHSFSFA